MHIPLPGEELQLGVGPETGAEYLRVGQTVKDAIVGKTGLPSAGSVLDVGCGSGRMARHFVDHVRRPGRYVGMDIQKDFVDWCNDNITPVNEAFEFYHQDIYNGGYNPDGKVRASEYRFPFEDGSFDAIILYSVFTHLLPEDALNYMREVARLLKPDGRVYSTWYLLTRDEEVRYLMPNIREGQVGYGFPHLVGMLERAGLRVDGSRMGRWHGSDGDIWQDLLWLGGPESVPKRFPLAEPPAPERAGEPSTFSGTLEDLDPVSQSFAVSGEGERRTFSFSGKTRVIAHGEPGGLSALRAGQRTHVFYPGGSEGTEPAVKVIVRGQPRRERVQGTVEAVDWDADLISLSLLDAPGVSVRFDLKELEGVVINGKQAKLSDLKPGQLAGVYTVPLARFIEALDPPEG